MHRNPLILAVIFLFFMIAVSGDTVAQEGNRNLGHDKVTSGITGRVVADRDIFYSGDPLKISVQFPHGTDMISSGQVDAYLLIFQPDASTLVVPVSNEADRQGRVLFDIDEVDVETLPAGVYQLGLVMTVPDGDPLDVKDWYNGPMGMVTVRGLTVSDRPLDVDTDGDGQLDNDSNSDGIDDGMNNFRFEIDSGVPSADEEVIREGLNLAQKFFRDTFGRIVPGKVTINIQADTGNYPAFAGAEEITFNVENSGWTDAHDISKQKIAVHELFHVFQNRYDFIDNPRWFIEGSAEYIGFQAIDYAGLLDFETARGCQNFSLAHSSDPVPSLRDGGIPDNGAYWLAFLAIDFMAGSQLDTFATIINQASSSWDDKLNMARELSADEFYDAFGTERQNFSAPPNYECL